MASERNLENLLVRFNFGLTEERKECPFSLPWCAMVLMQAMFGRRGRSHRGESRQNGAVFSEPEITMTMKTKLDFGKTNIPRGYSQ